MDCSLSADSLYSFFSSNLIKCASPAYSSVEIEKCLNSN